MGSPTAAPTVFRLSDRQHQVLTLAAWGNTRRQIARELQMSERTVKADLRAAADALGGLNTTHTVALAIAAQLITAPVLAGGSR